MPQDEVGTTFCSTKFHRRLGVHTTGLMADSTTLFILHLVKFSLLFVEKGLMMLTDDAPGNTDYLINQLRSWNRAQNDDVMFLIYGIGKSA